MILQTFVFDAGPLEVNHYILVNEDSREGLLVDAGVCGEALTRFVAEEKIAIKAILLTHHHHDHVDALGEFRKLWPEAEVYSPAPITSAPNARIISEGDSLEVCGFQFKVFKTSGHTPESISYYCSDSSICFVGDAIFAGAVGGTSSDELHAEETGHLHSKILTLPPETELLSGHGPATTVAIEKAANPFLQPGFTRLPKT